MDKTIKIKIGNFESDYNDLLRIYISISKLNLENNGSNKSLKYLLQHNCLDSGDLFNEIIFRLIKKDPVFESKNNAKLSTFIYKILFNEFLNVVDSLKRKVSIKKIDFEEVGLNNEDIDDLNRDKKYGTKVIADYLPNSLKQDNDYEFWTNISNEKGNISGFTGYHNSIIQGNEFLNFSNDMNLTQSEKEYLFNKINKINIKNSKKDKFLLNSIKLKYNIYKESIKNG